MSVGAAAGAAGASGGAAGAAGAGASGTVSNGAVAPTSTGAAGAGASSSLGSMVSGVGMGSISQTLNFGLFGDSNVTMLDQKAAETQDEARFVGMSGERKEQAIAAETAGAHSRQRALLSAYGAAGTAQADAIMTGTTMQGAISKMRVHIDTQNQQEVLRAQAQNMKQAANMAFAQDILGSALTVGGMLMMA